MAENRTAENKPSEAHWIEGECIRSLMLDARNTQRLAIMVIPVMAGALYAGANHWVLLVWTLLALSINLFRLHFMLDYARHLKHADTVAQHAFLARYGFSWPLSAAIWGLTSVMYYDSQMMGNQFLCWLIIIGFGTFAINTFSMHWQTVRNYINALVLPILGTILWHIVVIGRFAGPQQHYYYLILTLIFWVLLLSTAKRFYQRHRQNLSLLSQNDALIESLTHEKLTALDAVETKNRFLASAAHDLRQPVLALGLYADWLHNEPDLALEITPKIIQSTKAVNALFDSLFDLVRLDTGEITGHLVPVDLGTLAHELELQYLPLAWAKKLKFKLHLAHGTIVSDPILLKRILGNLISNAIKYTHWGGIIVATRRTRQGLQFEVWDTGLGIEPKYQEKIFTEFYKISVHSGTEDGFGLGLSIVARLSQLLGYKLRMQSRPGRGSVFKLLLPDIEVT